VDQSQTHVSIHPLAKLDTLSFFERSDQNVCITSITCISWIVKSFHILTLVVHVYIHTYLLPYQFNYHHHHHKITLTPFVAILFSFASFISLIIYFFNLKIIIITPLIFLCIQLITTFLRVSSTLSSIFLFQHGFFVLL
jgi:hypothetical protein